MKKLYIILLSALVLTSCGDEFLDLQPESVADIKDIYKTETDFIQAMIGAYDELQSSGQYGRNFHYLFDTRADLVGESTAGFQDGIYYEIDRFLLRSENPLIQQTWASLYTGINRANLIIEKLDESSVLASTKRNLNAEARFIRALSYFNIVRIWGAAPLITKTISPDEALEVTRNSKLDIYNFIIAELDQISTTLPAAYDAEFAGRATKYAASALLGKVYLENGDYQNASTVLKEVIDAGVFDLQPTFSEVFPIQNEMNPEIIFAVRWKRLVEETNLFFGRATLPVTLSSSFLDSFDTNDQRLSASEIGVIGSYSVPVKFIDPAGSDGKTGLDFPVLRFADVLLMYAEALNELGFQPTGEAFDALNNVRVRAGLTALTSTTITDQQAFRNALLDERKKELIYEGHAWFDLIRLGDAKTQILETLGLTISEGQFIYPIPQSEINRIGSDRFQQNPAYQ
ncbi:MAG: RagB/SusD family nutrient uptake outer membrane protein [Cyclobacteriaceae bacterium]